MTDREKEERLFCLAQEIIEKGEEMSRLLNDQPELPPYPACDDSQQAAFKHRGVD